MSETTNTCPICYEEYDNNIHKKEGNCYHEEIISPCIHFFCKDCIIKLGQSQDGKCPICRENIEHLIVIVSSTPTPAIPNIRRTSNQRTSNQRTSNQRTSNQRTSNQRTSNQRNTDTDSDSDSDSDSNSDSNSDSDSDSEEKIKQILKLKKLLKGKGITISCRGKKNIHITI